jgi:hypothetical protein
MSFDFNDTSDFTDTPFLVDAKDTSKSADEWTYETGKTSSRGNTPGLVAAYDTPHTFANRHPRQQVTGIRNVTNPMDIQRVFRLSGYGGDGTSWGYDTPVRSRVNNGLITESQRGAHPRHHTGAVIPPDLIDRGLSSVSLGGASTRASGGSKRNVDLLEREHLSYIATGPTYGGVNMGQQLAAPMNSAWRSRRMYADTQLMRPPSAPSDMAALLNNPYVARNWNYANLQEAIAHDDWW